jgi:integrase
VSGNKFVELIFLPLTCRFPNGTLCTRHYSGKWNYFDEFDGRNQVVSFACWVRRDKGGHGRGHITANPVTVVDHILPKQSSRPEHQSAMPWRQVPQFVATHLAEHELEDSTRAALLFLILTATRSGEVRGATWDEFDLRARIWNILAARMKAKEPHRVPMSDKALTLVKTLKKSQLHDSLVFPSPREKVLSDMTLTALLRSVKAESDTSGRFATAHGFRSGFRDWASEHDYARDLAERALAHTVANKVEAAYHRTDLLEQRRPLMEAWARHICSG